MATSHWPIKLSVFWLYIVCVFLWCMENTYNIILNYIRSIGICHKITKTIVGEMSITFDRFNAVLL